MKKNIIRKQRYITTSMQFRHTHSYARNENNNILCVNHDVEF